MSSAIETIGDFQFDRFENGITSPPTPRIIDRSEDVHDNLQPEAGDLVGTPVNTQSLSASRAGRIHHQSDQNNEQTSHGPPVRIPSLERFRIANYAHLHGFNSNGANSVEFTQTGAIQHPVHHSNQVENLNERFVSMSSSSSSAFPPSSSFASSSLNHAGSHIPSMFSSNTSTHESSHAHRGRSPHRHNHKHKNKPSSNQNQNHRARSNNGGQRNNTIVDGTHDLDDGNNPTHTLNQETLNPSSASAPAFTYPDAFRSFTAPPAAENDRSHRNTSSDRHPYFYQQQQQHQPLSQHYGRQSHHYNQVQHQQQPINHAQFSHSNQVNHNQASVSVYQQNHEHPQLMQPQSRPPAANAQHQQQQPPSIQSQSASALPTPASSPHMSFPAPTPSIQPVASSFSSALPEFNIYSSPGPEQGDPLMPLRGRHSKSNRSKSGDSALALAQRNVRLEAQSRLHRFSVAEEVICHTYCYISKIHADFWCTNRFCSTLNDSSVVYKAIIKFEEHDQTKHLSNSVYQTTFRKFVIALNGVAWDQEIADRIASYASPSSVGLSWHLFDKDDAMINISNIPASASIITVYTSLPWQGDPADRTFTRVYFIADHQTSDFERKIIATAGIPILMMGAIEKSKSHFCGSILKALSRTQGVFQNKVVEGYLCALKTAVSKTFAATQKRNNDSLCGMNVDQINEERETLGFTHGLVDRVFPSNTATQLCARICRSLAECFISHKAKNGVASDAFNRQNQEVHGYFYDMCRKLLLVPVFVFGNSTSFFPACVLAQVHMKAYLQHCQLISGCMRLYREFREYVRVGYIDYTKVMKHINISPPPHQKQSTAAFEGLAAYIMHACGVHIGRLRLMFYKQKCRLIELEPELQKAIASDEVAACENASGIVEDITVIGSLRQIQNRDIKFPDKSVVRLQLFLYFLLCLRDNLSFFGVNHCDLLSDGDRVLRIQRDAYSMVGDFKFDSSSRVPGESSAGHAGQIPMSSSSSSSSSTAGRDVEEVDDLDDIAAD